MSQFVRFLCGNKTNCDDCHRENLLLLEEIRRMVQERDNLVSTFRDLQEELIEKQTEVVENQAMASRFKKQADEFRETFLANNTRNQKASTDVDSRIRTLQQQLIEKNAEVGEKQAMALRFKEEADEFREIFLAEAGKQKVSDDEVIQSFLNMRQRALALIKFKGLRFDQVPALERNAPHDLREFYGDGTWASWSHTDRELHVRQKVFEILYRRILDAPCFGIEGLSDTQDGKVTSVSRGLSGFEAMLKEKKLSLVSMSNWRRATIECAEGLGIQEQLSDRVAEELLTFLGPILNNQSRSLPKELFTYFAQGLNNQSRSLPERLQSMALNLCRDAFKLTIMMRKAQDEYRCDAIQHRVGRPTSNFDTWAEPHAVDGGNNDEAGDDIAYVLFGALTKKSLSYEGIERVLVKAEVVMARRL
ncbi:hypothetical protein KVR01_004608 [Diaporthe batatas]|uniref:uncharacterized protein n=1 Tax=Diaporthe batatas TaxID=748121 RepID=UPI001D05900B|nr:uncharacterized protein KVR01_004608 [Diaporthe batatas]KAG8166056.1 hypothetical protein KVR01_004608 [Diaporthe batatas]